MTPRALALIVGLALVTIATPAHARGFATGYLDPFWLGAGGARFDEARASGASFIRVQVDWSAVAPQRPADPANADDPGYRWGALDAIVAGARVHGLVPVLSVDHAPTWAEGPARPARAIAGSWRPDAAATGTFAGALARRYAGQVRYVQIWNEPNLPTYLAPQRTAPKQYRHMLNAAWTPVHAAGMKLVTAGAAPYGGTGRTRPVRFWRRALAATTRFDVFAHQPYSVGRPAVPASHEDDVSIADVHKLVRLVRRKVRAGTARPHRRKPTWVTELSWDSNPPDPDGVPERRRARWTSDAFAILWRQGVDHVFWTRVRDEPEGRGYPYTYQSGMYFADGRPKGALRAFRFPFSCKRVKRGTRLWLKAPSRGRVTIRWQGRTVARLRAGSTRVATKRIARRGRFVARIGSTNSLSCKS